MSRFVGRDDGCWENLSILNGCLKTMTVASKFGRFQPGIFCHVVPVAQPDRTVVQRIGSFMTPGASATAGKECFALVQRSTPGPWYQASLAFSQAGFATIERQEGVRFDIDRFMFDDGTRMSDLQRQARRAAETGVLGIAFMPSRYTAEAA